MIHLPHCVGDFRCVLLSGKAVEEIGEEEQRTDKGKNRHGEKHGEEPSGERSTVCWKGVSPAMGGVA